LGDSIMAKVKIQGNASGTGVLTVTAPNTSTDRTITLPDSTGTLATTADTGVAGITSAADATAMTILSNERIGINHTTPEARLEIDGGSETGLMVRSTVSGEYPAIIQSASTNTTPILSLRKSGGTETVRFSSEGGILFNGDSAAANALDDYEEGTWSPTITCTTSGSYTLQGAADLAAYTKIGRVVTVQGGLSVNGESSPNGNLRITLPFTAFQSTDDTDFSMGNLALGNHGSTLDVAGLNAFVMEGNYFFIWGVNPDGTTRYINHNDVDTSWQVYFNFTYIAA